MSYKLWALICVELLYISLLHFQHIFRSIFNAFLITILQIFIYNSILASYFHSSSLHSLLQSSITFLNEFQLFLTQHAKETFLDAECQKLLMHKEELRFVRLS